VEDRLPRMGVDLDRIDRGGSPIRMEAVLARTGVTGLTPMEEVRSRTGVALARMDRGGFLVLMDAAPARIAATGLTLMGEVRGNRVGGIPVLMEASPSRRATCLTPTPIGALLAGTNGGYPTCMAGVRLVRMGATILVLTGAALARLVGDRLGRHLVVLQDVTCLRAVPAPLDPPRK
jgi:hypothetical protein